MPPLPTQRPYMEITEQPHPKALRFRYECEGRSAGSIPGVNTTADHKTFPSIQVHGYRGRAVVVVSCVAKEGPNHKPHPHNLVGKEHCRKGVCTVEINSTTMSYNFNNLGIQCVRKKDVDDALKLRQEIRVDPFRTGFAHAKEPGSIDLNAVRLCFQVFLEGQQRGRFTEPLAPVVSDIIYDKKAMSDLIICRLSDSTAPVCGGKEIILLCEKVVKEDIKVRFFEKKGNMTVWENYAEFSHTDVHKQVAISFRTPPYRSIDITESVEAYVQLVRPSDNAFSEALKFEFTPVDIEVELRRKRQKCDSSIDSLRDPKRFAHMNTSTVPKLVNHDDNARENVAPQRMYNYNTTNSLLTRTPKEEIKDELGESSPNNEPCYQPMQGMMITQHPATGTDRSPIILTPSPVAVSPQEPDSVTPTTLAYTTLNGPVGNNPYGEHAVPPQRAPTMPMPMFDVPGPSNGWVQTAPSLSNIIPSSMGHHSRHMDHSLSVGNFRFLSKDSMNHAAEPTSGMVPTSVTNNYSMNPSFPPMNSDINLNMVDFEPVLNSSEIRWVLGTLAPATGQGPGTGYHHHHQNASYQPVMTPLAGPPAHGQQPTLPDLHDIDEELTDSFTKLSTN